MPDAICAAAAAFAFAGSMNEPTMTVATLIFGLAAFAPAVNPARPWIVGGINAPPTKPTFPVFENRYRRLHP